MRVAVIGAGWAGLAAAVAATAAGHRVSVFEAAHQPGGRARALAQTLPDGQHTPLDNGQHILIGAYTQTLALMRTVGVQPRQVLRRLPLTLRFPDGGGLSLPRWPAPLDIGMGIACARGWQARDKLALLRVALRWRRQGFDCPPQATVPDICEGLTPRVMAELIEPLCVSALNTPPDRSCAQVFLRVLRDALLGPGDGDWGASNLLLPCRDLGAMFPGPAAQWLARSGGQVLYGRRVQALVSAQGLWQVDGQAFDQVLLACPAREAARLAHTSGMAPPVWIAQALALRHEAITTVYAIGGPRLPWPLMALRSGPDAPAQFVFDRAQLGGPPGLLAFVVSASSGKRDELQGQVLAQARALGWQGLSAVQTVVDKRATFACTPGLRRPATHIAAGLLACGDYIEGPYPATLEGAVRSGLAAADLLPQAARASAP